MIEFVQQEILVVAAVVCLMADFFRYDVGSLGEP